MAAEEKETIIFNFEVENGDALNNFEKLKKGMIELKDEQKVLQKAYKDGQITLDEFVKGTVKNEQALKRQATEYNNLTKTVSGHKSKIDELIKSNEKLGDAFKDASNEIKIHGVGLSDLTSKVSGLVNPVTIAVGAVGLLAEAYAESTRGAKDLEFAQLQMEQATKLVVNGFANMVTSAKDGEGALTKLFNIGLKFSGVGLLDALGITNIQGKSKELALAAKELEDLGREELDIRAKMSDRLEENAQLSAKVADSTTSQNDRLDAQRKIIENLRDNQKEIVEIKTKELSKLKEQLDANQDDEVLQEKVKQATADVARESARIERMIQNQEKALSNIVDAENKRVKANQELTSELERQARIARNERSLKGDTPEGLAKLEQDLDTQTTDVKVANADRAIEATKKYMEAKVQQTAKESVEAGKQKQIDMLLTQQKLANITTVLNMAKGALDEGTAAYKILAISQTLIDTYRAATAALAPPPIGAGPLLGPILAGVTVATGLANVSKIAGFSEGGYTGSGGKYEPAGIVHKGEVVFNQRDVAALGGAMAVNRLRPTYYDGGIVASAMTSKLDAMVGSNRNMPAVYASITEIRNMDAMVQIKENLVSI